MDFNTFLVLKSKKRIQKIYPIKFDQNEHISLYRNKKLIISLLELNIFLPFAIGVVSILVIFGLVTSSIQNNLPDADNIKEKRIFSIDSGFVLDEENPIKVGILHSLSGTMAISETPVVDATLLAIDQINERGGILGKKVVPVIFDGRSDWPTFALQAEKLIVEEDVCVVFGGWTSASRKTMKPIFEEHDHLLFYPVQYEGLEQSPNIIYTGAAPNQQVLPAIDWAIKNLGDTFFLVGSDYVFPRSANEIMKGKISESGGKVLGEEYVLLGSDDFANVVTQIEQSNPKVILNTINGDSNVAFFKELRSRGITPDTIPTISFSIAEDEIRHLGAERMQGDYASWNYFQSLDNKENIEFVDSFKTKFGSHRVTDDPMEAGYIGVFLYAKAVEAAGTDDVQKVREKLRGLTISAPEGVVGIDPINQHLSKSVRIGKILSTGQFEIVSSSDEPIRPIPYPDYKTPEQWNIFLNELYLSWNQNWANPGTDSQVGT